MTKEETINQLQSKHAEFSTHVAGFGQDKVNTAVAGKWSPAGHLRHIYQSVKPLAMAMGLPKLAIVAVAGKANRPSVSYDELVARYKAQVEKGAVATGKYVPPTEQFNLAELQEKVSNIVTSLTDKISGWKEEDLDKYFLPHPLLGKITVREMLYFTLYHVQHHDYLLKRDYEI